MRKQWLHERPHPVGPSQLEMHAMVTWGQVDSLPHVAGSNHVHKHRSGHGEVHKTPAIGAAFLRADLQPGADDGPGRGIEHHDVQVRQGPRGMERQR